MNKIPLIALLLSFFLVTGVYGVLQRPGSGDNEPSAASTKQFQYYTLRTVTSADTALTAAQKYYDPQSNSAGVKSWMPIDGQWNRVELAFYAYGDGTGDGDPNGGDFDIKVYASRYRSAGKTVYEGYCRIGELELMADPVTANFFATTSTGTLDPNESYKWADYCEPNGVGERWPSGVSISGHDEGDSTGDILTLSFDAQGYYGVWVEVDQMSGITSLKCLMTGY